MTDSKQDDKSTNETLSFEAITAEIGDVSIPVKDESDKEATAQPDTFGDIGGTVMVDETAPARTPVSHDMQDRLNSRVLTGGSPQSRPVWVEGLACGILAGLVMAPVVLRIALVQYQPWISYMAILLSGGAALWSLYGLQVEETTEGRRMCVVSAAICIAVMVVAFLVRHPPSP